MIKVKCICSSNICRLEDHINEFLEEIQEKEYELIDIKPMGDSKVIIVYKDGE